MKKITLEFLDFVKEIFSTRTIPPSFNPNEWKEKSFNCYAYCFDICTNLIGYRTNPGFLVGLDSGDYNYNKESLINFFKQDCNELNLHVAETTMDEEISDNEYKIALYLNSKGGFHCARQDANGQWSDKDGWCGSIEILKKEDIIKTLHSYTLAGVYRVSRKE